MGYKEIFSLSSELSEKKKQYLAEKDIKKKISLKDEMTSL